VSGRLRIIDAIVRKDLAVLWPLAVIVVLLPVLRTDAVLERLQNDNLRAGTLVVSALATSLLILGVMHEDASASLRHDWLTRPIPRRTLVTAKLLFIAVIVYLPASVTDFVSTLADGRPAGEALARATSINSPALAGMLVLIVFAVVTSTLLQAAGALVAFVVAVFLAQAVSSSVLDEAKGTVVAGAEWLSLAPVMYLPIVLAAPVLWLQYGRRRTVLARAIVAAMCISAVVPLVTPPRAMFGVLKLLSAGTEAGATAGLVLAPGCFPRVATETGSGAVSPEAQRLWDGDQRAKAGPGAIAFSTTVVPTGVPRGWKTMIGFAQASYADANGGVSQHLHAASGVFSRPETVDASMSATHFWLAPGDAYQAAGQRSARLRLNYFVSLLEPVASAEIDVDGERRYLPGLGYCSTVDDRSNAVVSVDCFVRGRRPALVAATWSGVSGVRVTLTAPDYTPAALEILNGMPYRLALPRPPGGAAARVTLLAYEARRHVEVPVDAPDPLGGASCSISASNRTLEGEQP
jgi:hypothetical protein